MSKSMRIALVSRQSESDWISCKSITRNLLKSYRLAFGDRNVELFNCDEELTRLHLLDECSRMREFGPDRVCFIDHHPHPGYFLWAMDEVFGKALPAVVIHVFGDFPLHSDPWLWVEPVLKKGRARFICASEKQRKLVSGVMRNPEKSVTRIPFPVEADDFRLQRRESRRGSGAPVFLYTGRISQQKNCLALLGAFAVYLQHVNPDASLWIAGPVDDLGMPYLGEWSRPGTYSCEVRSAISRYFPGMLARRVRYFGDCDESKLLELYNGADAYVSLSTHNDEDFGMAPAEAALCGLPLILTDWGGYSSFAELGGNHCSLIPVKAERSRNEPDLEKFLLALTELGDHLPSAADRHDIASKARSLYSCEAVAGALKTELRSDRLARFTGFDPLMREIARAFRFSGHAPFNKSGEFSPLYRRFYEAYL